jgi:hypothetical protein
VTPGTQTKVYATSILTVVIFFVLLVPLCLVSSQSSYNSFIFAVSSLILNGLPLTFGNETAGTR